MSLFELVILALGLSMDAFAVAVCLGVGIKKVTFKKMLIVGLYFGIFQAVMPLIGYLIASLFADSVTAAAPWIAFCLLLFLGVKMIWGAFEKDNKSEDKEIHLGPKKMLPFAIATSIDALAVGVTFALLDVKIVPAILLIGITTLGLSMIAVKIGNIFGLKFKSKAELAGGIILILIGVKILLSHWGVIGF